MMGLSLFNAGLSGQDGPTPYGTGNVTTGTLVTQAPERVPVEFVDMSTVYGRGMTVGKMKVKDSDKAPGWPSQ